MEGTIMNLYEYTAVGFYADNNQPWVAYVFALTAEDAKKEAVRTQLDLNGWDEDFAAEVQIVCILEGRCHPSSKLESVTSGSVLA